MSQWHSVRYPNGASRSRIALPSAGDILLPAPESHRSWHTIKPPQDQKANGINQARPRGAWPDSPSVLFGLIVAFLITAGIIGLQSAGTPQVPVQEVTVNAAMPDRVDRSVETASADEAVETAESTEPGEIPLTNLGSGQTIRMLATAYTLECGNGDGVTATGTTPRPGIIAVDPRVIPHDTLVYIDDYGYFRAEDTGGVIKGDRIDVFMHSRTDALRFGKRWVDVKVIGKFQEPGLVKRFP